MKILGERKKPTVVMAALLRNRLSAAALGFYFLLAVVCFASAMIGWFIGVTIAAVASGAVVLIVLLDIRMRLIKNSSVLTRGMQEGQRKAVGSHDYLVRIESRAKFRYERLARALAKADSERQSRRQLHESEIEDIRNVVAAALAVQRVEHNLLVERLMKELPRV